MKKYDLSLIHNILNQSFSDITVSSVKKKPQSIILSPTLSFGFQENCMQKEEKKKRKNANEISYAEKTIISQLRNIRKNT